MYTLLYLKWITDKDLLYSTWNSAQCYVAAWMGGEFGAEWIHVYVWLNPSAVHLKLSQQYTPIQNKKLYILKKDYMFGYLFLEHLYFWKYDVFNYAKIGLMKD